MADVLLFSTINQISRTITMKQLAQQTRKYINHHIFRGITLTTEEVLSLFHRISIKYQQEAQSQQPFLWIENQKKVYHCFILMYCSLHSKKIIEISEIQWDQFSLIFNKKSLLLLHYQAKVIQKSQDRVKWDTQEENMLHQCIRQLGKKIRNERTLRWTQISKHIYMKSRGQFFKTPKQCRQHWNNHLNLEIRHAGWSVKQDILILNFVAQKGRKWAKLAPLLQGKRTQHMIKNRYHSMMTCARKILKSQQKQTKGQRELLSYFRKLLLSKIDYDQQELNDEGPKITEVKKEVILKSEQNEQNVQNNQDQHLSNQYPLQENQVKIQEQDDRSIKFLDEKIKVNAQREGNKGENEAIDKNKWEEIHASSMMGYSMPTMMPMQWPQWPYANNPYQNIFYMPQTMQNQTNMFHF